MSSHRKFKAVAFLWKEGHLIKVDSEFAVLSNAVKYCNSDDFTICKVYNNEGDLLYSTDHHSEHYA